MASILREIRTTDAYEGLAFVVLKLLKCSLRCVLHHYVRNKKVKFSWVDESFPKIYISVSNELTLVKTGRVSLVNDLRNLGKNKVFKNRSNESVVIVSNVSLKLQSCTGLASAPTLFSFFVILLPPVYRINFTMKLADCAQCTMHMHTYHNMPPLYL